MGPRPVKFVDDLNILSEFDSDCQWLADSLMSHFELKDLHRLASNSCD